jgi:hypothetical protein
MLSKLVVTSRARRTSSDVMRNDVALGILQRITLTFALADNVMSSFVYCIVMTATAVFYVLLLYRLFE